MLDTICGSAGYLMPASRTDSPSPFGGDAELDRLFRDQLGPLDAYLPVGSPPDGSNTASRPLMPRLRVVRHK